jgi:succinate dehydrogenase/fumarate reductase flavoprotein subunit
MEQSTRDNLAIGIITEVLEGRGFTDDKGGYVLVSMRHLPDQIIELSPAVLAWVDKNFINKMKGGAAKCFPACHFFCGGIKINKKCETNIAGLYAIGEITGGMHGANRLSGNAITEVLVEGRIVGKEVVKFVSQRDFPKVTESQYEHLIPKILQPYERYGQSEGKSPIPMRKRIQNLAGTCAPVVRDEELLNKALKEIKEMQEGLADIKVTNNQKVYNHEWVEALQLENMLQTLEMIVRSALIREESRGGHYRRDFPQTDNKNWLKNSSVKKDERGQMAVTTMPAVITKIYPEEDN